MFTRVRRKTRFSHFRESNPLLKLDSYYKSLQEIGNSNFPARYFPAALNVKKSKLRLRSEIMIIQINIRSGVQFFVYILLMFYTAEIPEFFCLSLSQQILK